MVVRLELDWLELPLQPAVAADQPRHRYHSDLHPHVRRLLRQSVEREAVPVHESGYFREYQPTTSKGIY